MIRMDHHRVHRKKILMLVCRQPPYKLRPPKKEKCFHLHGLASLTCLVSTKKEELCISCFIFMKLLIKIGVQNSCTPISLFVSLTLPVKGYKNPQSKISVGTLPQGNLRSPHKNLAHINPFPNKPWFLRVCSTSLLKTP